MRVNRSAARVVLIGGGTGLSTSLRGFKDRAALVAIVTVTDDGGSSGRLRRERGIPAVGDIRRCLVALSDAPPSLKALFEYRFKHGPYANHSLGNIVISKCIECAGDFMRGIEKVGRLLSVRGRVLPSTLELVDLHAEMEDGCCVGGETAIVQYPARIRRLHLNPPTAAPLDEAVQAIEEADTVVVGPGSLYTSVMPNLLIKGIAEALRCTKALRIYVCNILTQHGETDGFTAADHVCAIEAHAGKRLFDCVLVNIARPRPELIKECCHNRQRFVEPDLKRIQRLGYRVVVGRFADDTRIGQHHPDRLADAILRLRGLAKRVR